MKISQPHESVELDIVVVGSGAAALSAALSAASGGLRVAVFEKSELLGGTSAMSGSAIWIPANHIARAAGFEDSEQEALEYLRATAPEGWSDTEDALWGSFVTNAPRMLALVAEKTPLDLRLTEEPDPMAECAGGKTGGRVVSPRPLRRAQAGQLGRKLRNSTLPNLFTYQESIGHNLMGKPFQTVLKLLPRLFYRLLTGARGQGNALITGLTRGCLDLGCRIELGTPVIELLQDDVGTVIGVEIERRGQREKVLASRGVVLATGGFEWDANRRETFFPGPLDFVGSPPTNRGDGHGMAERAGAALAHMDQANIYATLPTRYRGQAHGMPSQFYAARHAIVVNRQAERFVSEFDYNFGEAFDKRAADGRTAVNMPCWMIADQRYLKNTIMFRWYARYKPGWVVKAPNIGQLAERTGLDPQALSDTVARYNRFATNGRDEAFHRGESVWEQFKTGATEQDRSPALGTIEVAPFMAVRINRSILVTKGGPRTNAEGQVLREDGSVIGGLYCAGVAMANPIGTRNVGAGTTLGPCMTWGYICGQSLLRTNR